MAFLIDLEKERRVDKCEEASFREIHGRGAGNSFMNNCVLEVNSKTGELLFSGGCFGISKLAQPYRK